MVEIMYNRDFKDGKKHIAIDLDATLAEYDKWIDVYHFGKPIDGAREFLKTLRLPGENYYILIYTTRTNPVANAPHTEEELVGLVKKWLDENQMEYDEIYSGEGKPVVDVFIDDKAITCRPQDYKYSKVEYIITLNNIKEFFLKERNKNHFNDLK